VTEHQQNPEGQASGSPSGETEPALPATEAHAPGPGEVPPDTEVRIADPDRDPDAAPNVADTAAPPQDSDTAPTLIAQTPSAAAEDVPTAVTGAASSAAGGTAPDADAEAGPEPEPAPEPGAEVAPETAPAPAPGTKPATPPPEPPPLPPPPEPPPIALDSGHRTTAADRPEIPVAAAFVGGFVLAMILRRLAR
jgi:hypothetical protein